MIKLILFGTGEGAKKITSCIDYSKAEIIAYADNNIDNQGKTLDFKPIINPKEIINYNYDYILIASMYYDEISSQLLFMNVDKTKIIKFYYYDISILNTLITAENDFIKQKEIYDIFKCPISDVRKN